MGFTVQQATAALQHSGGSLDIALNSLLTPDQQNALTDVSRESRSAGLRVTPDGPPHQNSRVDTRFRHQATDYSHSDHHSGILHICTHSSCFADTLTLGVLSKMCNCILFSGILYCLDACHWQLCIRRLAQYALCANTEVILC